MFWFVKYCNLTTVIFLGCVANVFGCPAFSEYLTVVEFYGLFNGNSVCGKPDSEEVVSVKGHVDCANIFDKRHYPGLPYEKFAIVDKSGKTLEVWVAPSESEYIFDKIFSNCRLGNKQAFIKGKVTGFDMPVMGSCMRGYKLNLTYSADIFFM